MAVKDGKSQMAFDPPRTLPRGTGTKPAEYERAFIEIFGQSPQDLARFAMLRALGLTRRNRAEAEELVQEAFVRILRHTYKSPVNAHAYITRIMTRLFIDNFRKVQNRQKYMDTIAKEETSSAGWRNSTSPDTGEIVTEEIFSEEFRSCVQAVIDSSSNEDQRAVWQAHVKFLYEGNGHAGKQIEALTGFSEQKVKRLRAPFRPLVKEALRELLLSRTKADPSDII